MGVAWPMSNQARLVGNLEFGVPLQHETVMLNDRTFEPDPLTAVAGLGMRPLLFDVSPFDPITLMGSIIVIATATIAASLIPAASAARVEPRAALED